MTNESYSQNANAYHLSPTPLFQAVGFDPARVSQALQVREHVIFGYRPDITGYRVLQDFDVLYSKTIANPQFGPGGADQFLIQKFDKYLEPITTIDLVKLANE